mmetsp:Transcript_16634/g.63259  ORF Transcript_16634/g.63259 Transcript_16634/m.63259 type:complete len:265 (-) Transcript_16634:362-1156(-)
MQHTAFHGNVFLLWLLLKDPRPPSTSVEARLLLHVEPNATSHMVRVAPSCRVAIGSGNVPISRHAIAGRHGRHQVGHLGAVLDVLRVRRAPAAHSIVRVHDAKLGVPLVRHSVEALVLEQLVHASSEGLRLVGERDLERHRRGAALARDRAHEVQRVRGLLRGVKLNRVHRGVSHAVIMPSEIEVIQADQHRLLDVSHVEAKGLRRVPDSVLLRLSAAAHAALRAQRQHHVGLRLRRRASGAKTVRPQQGHHQHLRVVRHICGE